MKKKDLETIQENFAKEEKEEKVSKKDLETIQTKVQTALAGNEKIRRMIFGDNLHVGIGLFAHNYLKGESLTPLQRILVKCAHCRGIEHMVDDSMEDCPVDDCPLSYAVREIISEEDLGKINY